MVLAGGEDVLEGAHRAATGTAGVAVLAPVDLATVVDEVVVVLQVGGHEDDAAPVVGDEVGEDVCLRGCAVEREVNVGAADDSDTVQAAGATVRVGAEAPPLVRRVHHRERETQVVGALDEGCGGAGLAGRGSATIARRLPRTCRGPRGRPEPHPGLRRPVGCVGNRGHQAGCPTRSPASRRRLSHPSRITGLRAVDVGRAAAAPAAPRGACRTEGVAVPIAGPSIP